MNSPYAQMYGQTWSQGAYQQPQAGPPSGYGYSHAAHTQQVRQCNFCRRTGMHCESLGIGGHKPVLQTLGIWRLRQEASCCRMQCIMKLL